MKIKVRKITVIITLFLVLIMYFCGFFGCAKTGPIPNGLYGWCGDNNIYESIYKLTENDVRDSHAIEVKGDEIQRWTSGSVDYKAKIVEKDGKIRFDGYKWRDLLDILFRKGEKSGSNHDYRVVYNEAEKTITLTPVDISSEG